MFCTESVVIKTESAVSTAFNMFTDKMFWSESGRFDSIRSPTGPDYLCFEMLLSDGPGFQHSCNDPVRPIAPRNDFKIYLKGLLTTLMQYVFKRVHLLLRVYGPCM
jgi:hypothetical protein